MRKLTLLAAVAAAVLFSGCASIETSKPGSDLNNMKISASGTPVAHIQASNWGIYLFMIPLLTGSTENPGSIVLLQDTVNVKSVAQMVTKHSKDLGASQTLDMVSVCAPMSWMFHIREVSVSANAVK